MFSRKSFTDETGIEVSVGILTGDNKLNPDGNCLIMTTEILRNSLYKLKSKTSLYGVGQVPRPNQPVARNILQ